MCVFIERGVTVPSRLRSTIVGLFVATASERTGPFQEQPAARRIGKRRPSLRANMDVRRGTVRPRSLCRVGPNRPEHLQTDHEPALNRLALRARILVGRHQVEGKIRHAVLPAYDTTAITVAGQRTESA